MENKINEHDMSKLMMEVIRGGYKKIIKEVEDGQMQSSSDEINPIEIDKPQETSSENDVIELQPSDATYIEELKVLRDSVNPTIDFLSFNIYPKDKNVVIDGHMEKQESDNSGIFFKMALNSSDIETSMVDVELDDEMNESLKKLTGYFHKFKNEWGEKVRTEYKSKIN